MCVHVSANLPSGFFFLAFLFVILHASPHIAAAFTPRTSDSPRELAAKISNCNFSADYMPFDNLICRFPFAIIAVAAGGH